MRLPDLREILADDCPPVGRASFKDRCAVHYPQLSSGPSVDKLSERVSPSLCGRAAGPALRLALLVAVLIRLEEAAERVHRLVSMIALAFVERYYGKFEETELDAHWRLLAPMPP